MSSGNVGDINSNKKGDGARFNSNKPDISLIPLNILATSFYSDNVYGSTEILLVEAVRLVGDFQMDGKIDSLYKALNLLQNYWTDCARVFEYGKIKYAEWNWAKGMKWSIPIACIGRHFLKHMHDELIDEESGYSHIGHIMCNIVMLIFYHTNYTEGDDRYKTPE